MCYILAIKVHEELSLYTGTNQQLYNLHNYLDRFAHTQYRMLAFPPSCSLPFHHLYT